MESDHPGGLKGLVLQEDCSRGNTLVTACHTLSIKVHLLIHGVGDANLLDLSGSVELMRLG